MDIFQEVAVTSDENNLFSACKLWDVKTGNEIVRLRHGTTNPNCLAFIGDNHVICGSKDPKVLTVWALYKQVQSHLQIKCIAPINALAVSPYGTYCVGAITTKLYIWKISTGQLIAVKNDHHNTVTCIKFDQTESYFVSAAEDGLVIAWSMKNIINSAVSKSCETALMKPLHVWNDHTLGIRDVCITSWGPFPRVISVSRDKSCKIYNLLTGACVFSIYTDEELYSLALESLGRYLYLGTGSGAIFKVPTDSIVQEKSLNILKDYPDIFQEHQKTVTCLSISIDAQMLLSGSNDCTAIIWDINLKIPLKTLRNEGPVTNAFFRLYPPSLEVVGDKKKPQILIKPFQFSVSSFDNEMVEVILRERKSYKNYDMDMDSVLDSFFGEQEIVPENSEAIRKPHELLDSENMKLYTEAEQFIFMNEILTF